MADAVYGTLPTCCSKKKTNGCGYVFLKQVYWASKTHRLAGIVSVPTHDTHSCPNAILGRKDEF